MILFGHPTGAPFSHNAALAHFENGQLEAFCVPWMPTPAELALLRRVPMLRSYVGRLERRYFSPLAAAPKVQGRFAEWSRMARRIAFGGRLASEGLSYEANDWLMRTMRRESRRASVTAVHAYEDCSLWCFEEARRLGKACIYDLPIGYYAAWERRQSELAVKYSDWLPRGGLEASRFVRPQQKKREIELADLVLVPCSYVKRTVEEHAQKRVEIAPYGVDAEFWKMAARVPREAPLRFLYAGQCSLRKGLPILLEAWKRANLKDSTLELVGAWRLSDEKRTELAANVLVTGPLSPEQLRKRYQEADVFVFPSFFEGFGLVMLEAMSCGLPVIASDATAAPDFLDDDCGRVVPVGAVDSLADALTWFASSRDAIPAMSIAARRTAESCSWKHYRERVKAATANYY
jgi:glycosyltransferase involved in cell wall biosynthesis